MNRDGYRDQIVTLCDVGVFCINRSCSTAMAHTQSIMYTSIQACFSCTFSTIPICPLHLFEGPRVGLTQARPNNSRQV